MKSSVNCVQHPTVQYRANKYDSNGKPHILPILNEVQLTFHHKLIRASVMVPVRVMAIVMITVAAWTVGNIRTGWICNVRITR
jgi:hypothetical protein